MAKRKENSEDGIVFSTNPNFSFSEDEKIEVETLPAAKQNLRISLDKKMRAGKSVTLISGFVGKPEDLENLSKILKVKCSTGGSIKDENILIQGDLRDKILQILLEMGYKAKKIGG